MTEKSYYSNNGNKTTKYDVALRVHLLAEEKYDYRQL